LTFGLLHSCRLHSRERNGRLWRRGSKTQGIDVPWLMPERLSASQGVEVTPGVTLQKASHRGYGGRGCVICGGVGWPSIFRIVVCAPIAAFILMWWWSRPPSFSARWQPVVEHPLHAVSMARSGFCYPGRCRVG
jgi:hypothetical protein